MTALFFKHQFITLLPNADSLNSLYRSIHMNLTDLILIALILIALAFAAYSIYRRKKSGRGCCGSCSGCSSNLA